MVKYVLKRLALMLMVFLIIISLCFVLIKLLPNKPAEQFGKDMQLIEMRREALGYNKPMIEQYAIFVRRTLIGGDWGISESLYLGQNVWDKFMEKMPATVIVNAYTMIFAVPLGLLFGIYAALKKNKWQDHFISTAVMVFVSVPSYVYAFLVQYFLCFKLRIFPFQMEAGYDYFSWKTFVSLVPAILSLGFGTIAGLTRYTRAELTEVLTSDYLLLARTKGLPRADHRAPCAAQRHGSDIPDDSGRVYRHHVRLADHRADIRHTGRRPAVCGLDHRGHAGLQLLYAAFRVLYVHRSGVGHNRRHQLWLHRSENQNGE